MLAHTSIHTVKREFGIDTGDITQSFQAAGYRTKSAGFLFSDIDSFQYLVSACLDAAMTAALTSTLIASLQFSFTKFE